MAMRAQTDKWADRAQGWLHGMSLVIRQRQLSHEDYHRSHPPSCCAVTLVYRIASVVAIY